jgi:uncharacterized protein (DUF1499 family)
MIFCPPHRLPRPARRDEQTVSVPQLARQTDPGHSGAMTPFARLIACWLPACGAPAADGLPRPALLDMRQITRPASPKTALLAPAGTRAAPNMVAPLYPVAAQHLYEAVLAVAAGQPRTFVAATFPARRQAHFVARSAWFNFPDLITAQIDERGSTASTLTLYSRSVYGYSDLGVNRRRLDAWLSALRTTLVQPTEDNR